MKSSLKYFVRFISCVFLLALIIEGVVSCDAEQPTPVANPAGQVAILPTISNSAPSLTQTGGTYQQALSFKGSNRTYLIHLPPLNLVKGKLPLVLAFHGAGENALIMATRGLSAKADQNGFIVVYPDGSNQTGQRTDGFTWNSNFCCGYASQNKIDDVGFIQVLIEQLERSYNIDANRVYATGFSNGGMLSYLLAAKLSDKLAAIAPVSAEFRSNEKPTQPVPVLALSGKEDKVVAYANSAKIISSWAGYNGCSSAPLEQETDFVSQESFCPDSRNRETILYTIKKGGHEWFQTIKTLDGQDIEGIDLIWNFFANHPKS